jgi:hypothetical protein
MGACTIARILMRARERSTSLSKIRRQCCSAGVEVLDGIGDTCPNDPNDTWSG